MRYFSDKDFESITKLGLSGKRNEPDKVGKYRLGFNVVYHFAEVVAFVSKSSSFSIRGCFAK